MLVDLDGDDDLDLIVTDESDEDIAILYNAGDGTFGEGGIMDLVVEPSSRALTSLAATDTSQGRRLASSRTSPIFFQAMSQ